MTATQTAYDEMLSFLRSGPGLEQIAHYQHSENTLDRVAHLKHRAKTRELNRQEHLELREFKRIETFLQLLRIRAMRRIGMTD